MKDLTFWEIVKSDVLVIEGEFGRLWSALRAAERVSSVAINY